MDKREYIWLWRLHNQGRITNHWDRHIYSSEDVEKLIQKRTGEIFNKPSCIEHLMFPLDCSKPLDGYKAEKGETFFVCIKKKNSFLTTWEQFNSPHAAKKYICSLPVVKEVYIFSSKDMVMKV